MLKDKTEGNLDEAEEQLLEAVLYDLRMQYVALHDRREASGRALSGRSAG